MINLVEGLTELKTSIAQSSEQSVLQSNKQSVEQSKLAKSELKKEEQQAQALLGVLNSINESLGSQTTRSSEQNAEQAGALLTALNSINESLASQEIPSPVVEIVNQPSEKIIGTLDLLTASMETSIQPLLLSMEKKMDIDLRTLERIQELTQRVETLKVTASKETRTRRTKSKAKDESEKAKSETEKAKSSSDSKRF